MRAMLLITCWLRRIYIFCQIFLFLISLCYIRYITTDQEAKNDIKQLQTAIQDLKEENWEYVLQGKKFREEKTELENKLR